MEGTTQKPVARIYVALRLIFAAQLGVPLLLLNSLDKLPSIGALLKTEHQVLAVILFYWSVCGRAAHHFALIARNAHLLPHPVEMMTGDAVTTHLAKSRPGLLAFVPVIPPLIFSMLCSGLLCSRQNAIFLAIAICSPILIYSTLFTQAEGLLTARWKGERLSLPGYVALAATTLANLVMFAMWPLALIGATTWQRPEAGKFFLDVLISLGLSASALLVLAFPVLDTLGYDVGMPRTPTTAPIARIWGRLLRR
jgi:hypothetical protein